MPLGGFSPGDSSIERLVQIAFLSGWQYIHSCCHSRVLSQPSIQTQRAVDVAGFLNVTFHSLDNCDLAAVILPLGGKRRKLICSKQPPPSSI
jgi:hypothetical protein